MFCGLRVCMCRKAWPAWANRHFCLLLFSSFFVVSVCAFQRSRVWVWGGGEGWGGVGGVRGVGGVGGGGVGVGPCSSNHAQNTGFCRVFASLYNMLRQDV